MPAVLKQYTVRSLIHSHMGKRRYFSLGEPSVDHDMHCSDEVLDFPVYDLDVLVPTLLVAAESLILDLPGTRFFISGEIANAVLTHGVDTEPVAQEKFHSYSNRQQSLNNSMKSCRECLRLSLQEPRKVQSRSILRF